MKTDQPTPPKRCFHCGYILDGLPHDRCPECGELHDPDLPERYLATVGSGADLLFGAILGMILSSPLYLSILSMLSLPWYGSFVFVVLSTLGLWLSFHTLADGLSFLRHPTESVRHRTCALYAVRLLVANFAIMALLLLIVILRLII